MQNSHPTENLKLISLNIEKDKHVPLVVEFLKKENPDVICLQEVFVETFELLQKELGTKGVFDEQAIFKEGERSYIQGVAILSRFPIRKHYSLPYTEDVANKQAYQFSLSHRPESDSNKGDVNKQYSRTLLVAEIDIAGIEYKIATTHFTWGYYGYVDKDKNEFIWNKDESVIEDQIADAKKLIEIFKDLGEFVLCVDLNAPRGEKVFEMFARDLKDNIPKEYKTSIDGSLHRAGPLPFMVDGLFTTPGYHASNVTLKSGVSDHMAVVGEISK